MNIIQDKAMLELSLEYTVFADPNPTRQQGYNPGFSLL